MKILNFTHAHSDEAKALALANYEEERGFVPAGMKPPLSLVFLECFIVRGYIYM